jgi:IMP dehydrogenase
MATFLNEESKTFSEFLLIPRLTQKVHQPENVSLKTSLIRFEKGKKSALTLDIPYFIAYHRP